MAAMMSTASFAAGLVSPARVKSDEKAIVRPSTVNRSTMPAVMVQDRRRWTAVRATDAATGGGGEERGKWQHASERSFKILTLVDSFVSFRRGRRPRQVARLDQNTDARKR